MVTRRSFLGVAGATAGAVVAGSAAWRALVTEGVERGAPAPASTTSSVRAPSGVPTASGRTLVVIQLGGGNDGLNTLVPVADGTYHDLRPTLAVPDAEVLVLDGQTRFGFHPALAPLVPRWQSGDLAAVTGVGFPDQSRSHFQAMDTWWSGTADPSSTGWLGRWLDATRTDDNPLRAIALGSGSPALIGERSVATVVLDPEGFALRAPKRADADQLVEAFVATAEPLSGDPSLAAAQQALPASFDAVARLDRAQDGSEPDERDVIDRGRGRRTDITDLLQVAAGLIAQPIGTQVIVVGVTGFDTHARQRDSHPDLLADLGTGVATFLGQIDAQGRADDVLVVTTSEFGRRAADNGSGTDHGNAGTQFLAGGPVHGARVVGEVDLARLVGGDVSIAIDTGSLYAECLDWLGGPTDEILGREHPRLGLVSV